MNLLFIFPSLVWLIISGIFFAIGEFLSKKFSITPSWPYVALIIFIYALGTLSWLPAILQKNQLSITGTIWSVIGLLMTIFIGVIIFGEKLNALSIAGIIFAIISIILLSIA